MSKLSIVRQTLPQPVLKSSATAAMRVFPRNAIDDTINARCELDVHDVSSTKVAWVRPFGS